MLAKIMSVHRGEEGLAESFWLWLVFPVVLLFLAADIIQSNSLALFELSQRTESISIVGMRFDNLFSRVLTILRLLLLVLAFFFAIGVVRSARVASSRLSSLLAVGGAILMCAAVSAIVLRVEFREGSPDKNQIGFVVRKTNAQFPRPLGEWGTWQRLEYSDQVLSARVELNRSKIDRIDWENVRDASTVFACRLWKDLLTDSPVRKFEVDFYSSTTLFQSISVSRSACS